MNNQKLKLKLPNDQDASGRTFGQEELALIQEVLKSGTLIGTSGIQVKKLEEEFKDLFGVASCVAVANGTAACHLAYAALDLEPGSEIITAPITDMGAISPILYQQLIPVFADVDPLTLNMTPSSIEKVITTNTRAIVVTHLFGLPCDMNGILEIARRHKIPVIEDTAQAFLATVENKLAGTLGLIGCFSLQQGKHMTCGEGGLAITNDPELGRRMRLFRDKGWGFGDPNPDHYFLGLNYRMTELQGAVARAQLQKLHACVHKRRENAARMHNLLAKVPGISLPLPKPGFTHSYWKYPLIINADVIKGGAEALGANLKERGIWCVPRYIKKPAFECQVIREKKTFGTSGYPYTLPGSKRANFSEKPEAFPGTYKGLSQVVVLPWNENYTAEHLDYIAENIKESVSCLVLQ